MYSKDPNWLHISFWLSVTYTALTVLARAYYLHSNSHLLTRYLCTARYHKFIAYNFLMLSFCITSRNGCYSPNSRGSRIWLQDFTARIKWIRCPVQLFIHKRLILKQIEHGSARLVFFYRAPKDSSSSLFKSREYQTPQELWVPNIFVTRLLLPSLRRGRRRASSPCPMFRQLVSATKSDSFQRHRQHQHGPQSDYLLTCLHSWHDPRQLQERCCRPCR